MAAERGERDAEQGLISGEEKKVGETTQRTGRSIHPVFYIA
jgi:hypothetical protein